MLLSNAIDLYINYANEQGFTTSTVKNYKRLLERFNQYLYRKLNRSIHIAEVTTKHVKDFFSEIMSEEKYSAAARNSALTAVKNLCTFSCNCGYCKHNAATFMKKIRGKSKERQFLTEIELMKVLRAVQHPAVKAIGYTIFYTGLRLNECLKLKRTDIDLENDVISVHGIRQREDRIIPINDRLKQVLIIYLEKRLNIEGVDSLFTSENGTVLSCLVGRHLRKATKKVGVAKPVTSEVLRYSFAENLLARGAHVSEIQALMGHNKSRTTSLYLHIAMDGLQKAIDLL